MRLLLACVLLTLLTPQDCRALLQLNVSHRLVVADNSTDLSLTCTFTGVDLVGGTYGKMRILKRTSSGGSSRMTCLTAYDQTLDEGEKAESVRAEVQHGEKFLRMLWPKVKSSAISGEYVCDLAGYSAVDNQPVVERTEPLVLHVEPPLDLVKLYTMVVNASEKCCGHVAMVEGALQVLVDHNKAMTSRTEYLKNRLRDLNHGFLQRWPEGMYALMATAKGCPVDSGVTWAVGATIQHTESSTRNRDDVSTGNHFKRPNLLRVGSNNYLQIHFCSVAKHSTGPIWPQGSYCVTGFGNEVCPLGFQEGVVLVDNENTATNITQVGVQPTLTDFSKNTRWRFCCRRDAGPGDKISLPSASPFFLHRSGGRCQEVEDMEHREEYVELHAECCRSAFTGSVPDGKDRLPSVRLNVCYYTPKVVERGEGEAEE